MLKLASMSSWQFVCYPVITHADLNVHIFFYQSRMSIHMKWHMLLLINEVEKDTLIHTERDLREHWTVTSANPH